MGITKVIPAKENASVDLVPIDFVVDTILCAAWHVTLRPNNEIKVYNCTNNAHPLKYYLLLISLLLSSRLTDYASANYYQAHCRFLCICGKFNGIKFQSTYNMKS